MTEKPKTRPPAWVPLLFYVMLLVLFTPLIVLVFASFISEQEFSLHWYQIVFSDNVLWMAFLRSLLVAVISASFATGLGLLAAFSIIKWKSKWSEATRLFATISLSLPELVLALALISWFGILGLRLSLLTVVIAHITLVLPFATLIISARLKALDISIEDAARDLGASENEIFKWIQIPQMKSALLNAFLLSFLLSMDDFLVSYFTNGAGQDTLPVVLYSQMKAGLSPVLTALSVLILLLSSLICAVLLLLTKKRRQSLLLP